MKTRVIQPRKIRHPVAEDLAMDLAARIKGACERLEIAGSIRRGVQHVSDIEIVVIPRRETVLAPQQNLFSVEHVSVDILAEHVAALQQKGYLQVIKPGTHGLIPLTLKGNRYWRLWLTGAEVKVDLFLCTKETWGLIYTLRTGSGVDRWGNPNNGFNTGLLRRWKRVSGGGVAKAGRLCRSGRTVPTPEEEDVFDAVELPWIHPKERVDASVCSW